MPANHLPIGDITTSSITTGVRITNNIDSTTTNYPCQAVQLQILESATSYVYVASAAAVTTTGATANIYVALHPEGPTSWSIGNPHQPNPLNAAGYFVVPAVAGEGVRGSIMKTGTY